MKKVYSILGIGFLYIAIMMLINITSVNSLATSKSFVKEIFADITFDAQDSNKWYNKDNPTANASVTPNAVPVPVRIQTLPIRDSH